MATKKPEPKVTPVERPRAHRIETEGADAGKILREAKAVIAANRHGDPVIVVPVETNDKTGVRQMVAIACHICGGTFAADYCPTDGNKLHE